MLLNDLLNRCVLKQVLKCVNSIDYEAVRSRPLYLGLKTAYVIVEQEVDLFQQNEESSAKRLTLLACRNQRYIAERIHGVLCL